MNNITRNLSRFGILLLVSFAAMAQRPWQQMTAPTVREAVIALEPTGLPGDTRERVQGDPRGTGVPPHKGATCWKLTASRAVS
jgi:hypothetical protein